MVFASAVEGTEALEDLLGFFDLIGLTVDPDFAVARQDLDPESVANLPEVLVAAAEDGEFFRVTIQTD